MIKQGHKSTEAKDTETAKNNGLMEGRGDVDGTEDGEIAAWESGLRVERGRGEKHHEGQFGDLSADIHHHSKMVKCPKRSGYCVYFLE